jgi:putative transposase
MPGHDAYRALPTKGAPQVLRLRENNGQSDLAACAADRDDPSKVRKHPKHLKHLKHPKLPHYQPKQDGRYALVYPLQALSRPGLQRGLIQPSLVPITMPTPHYPAALACVRSVPRSGFSGVEGVCDCQEAAPSGNPAR